MLALSLTGMLAVTASDDLSGARRDPYARARQQMVSRYLVPEGIRDPRVLQSIRTTPRHEFLPRDKRHLAYFDMAIPIGYGQTISPPYVVAFMTEQLKPQPTDKVLEIGTGSGYQAAVLAPLVQDVYTIEIVEPLGRRAAATLQHLGYRNVHCKIGDGFAGWPEHAPFQKIIVTCSPEKIPQPLIDQLADGGQIVVPLGKRFQQTLCRFTKVDGQLRREPLQATFFVPMTGQAEENRQQRPKPGEFALVNGSFEQALDERGQPVGWYYLRQAEVTQADDAPDGQRVILFRNRTPGRSAHALQAIGVDGILSPTLNISFSARARNIRAGDPNSQPRLLIEFYGPNRSTVGQAQVGPIRGTFDWRRIERQVQLPPQTELAVVGIGLFGAVGELAIDDVRITAATEPDVQP